MARRERSQHPEGVSTTAIERALVEMLALVRAGKLPNEVDANMLVSIAQILLLEEDENVD